MLGQSALFTTFTLNMTRRMAFCIYRNMGKSPLEAMNSANEIAIASGVTAGTIGAVLTLDPIGAMLSAGYVTLEASEADRLSQPKRLSP